MLNKKVLSAAITAAVMAGAAQAQERDDVDAGASNDGFEISGNVALTSDYRFRGISQSDKNPAIQGGFDIEFANGLYVGTWGSSVDFDTNFGCCDGSLELDYYGGWSSAIGDTDFGIDVGYIWYDYPGDSGDEGDYGEVYFVGSWKDLSIGVNYSDDYYASTGKFFYYAADYSFSLFQHFSVGLHVGYNDFDKAGEFLSNNQDSYTDWSISLGYSWAGVDFSVAYVDTDLDDEDVYDTNWADSTAVFTISKSM